jgi:hypothetical protein
MATIHVPTSEATLRSLALIASARGTSVRHEVNEAVASHIGQHAHFVATAAEEMTPERRLEDHEGETAPDAAASTEPVADGGNGGAS